mmetsp:Transcript_40201/g.95515  ORF Transcript_40201/g.95515 Transcript_40201/m.95515 type:complete len:208 (-) Transcript_40201:2036-2659(-)
MMPARRGLRRPALATASSMESLACTPPGAAHRRFSHTTSPAARLALEPSHQAATRCRRDQAAASDPPRRSPSAAGRGMRRGATQRSAGAWLQGVRARAPRNPATMPRRLRGCGARQGSAATAGRRAAATGAPRSQRSAGARRCGPPPPPKGPSSAARTRAQPQSLPAQGSRALPQHAHEPPRAPLPPVQPCTLRGRAGFSEHFALCR